jgi:peptide/nickel transport system permease protein
MGTYVVRRVLIAVPVLFGITVIAFTLLSLAPGDPLTARMDPTILAGLTVEQKDELRRDLGLDGPVWIRYGRWLAEVAQGNLGFSVVTGRPVAVDLAAAIPPTLMLMGTAFLIGTVVGIPLGLLAAVRHNTVLDHVASTGSLFFIVVPGFVLGLLAIYLFAVWLDLLPSGGMTTLGGDRSVADVAAHLVMPATILGLALAAPLMRYTRASVLETLSAEFVVAARSKGLSRPIVLRRHVLRVSLLPILTVLGLALPELVAGAVITEQVFNWPGMGTLAVEASSNRDPALMMGIVLVVATAVLAASLLTDLAYAVADPRVRYER